jgi:hypothetical protein
MFVGKNVGKTTLITVNKTDLRVLGISFFWFLPALLLFHLRPLDVKVYGVSSVGKEG